MGSLTPDRQVLAQFTDLMFKRARRDAFISLRLFPDKGNKKERPIDIEAIRINDKAFHGRRGVLEGAARGLPVEVLRNDHAPAIRVEQDLCRVEP